jgi:hypothetical protein
MPEGIPYSSQNVASIGKELNYVGSHCYAYSGEVSVANTEINLLDFVSGKDYITAKVQVGSKAGENEDFVFKIYFNGTVVFSTLFNNQGTQYVDVANSIPIIIPPLTNVQMSLDNIADSDTRVWTVGLTGKLHQ